MSGGSFLGLILISMAWFFFFLGTAMNIVAWRKAGRGIPFLPGVFGSAAAFLTVAQLEAPWPWLWILLPLFLDPYCLGWVLLRLFKK